MTEAAPITLATNIKVPFYDVDSMGIVWHGHYVKYFEDARCQLLDALGYNYQHMRDSGYGFPVVDIRLKYVKPAKFNRMVRVEAKLQEWEVRLKIDYRIIDIDSGETLTKGYSVQVAVDLQSGEMCYAAPAILQEKIAAYRLREAGQ